MSDAERRSLAEVLEEYAALRRVAARSPELPDRAIRNLEATYLVRLYAAFEGILRVRLSLADDRESGIASLVQRISGESVGYDPAEGGRSMAWWRLLSRDRNQLTHGRGLTPAIGIERPRTLMEEYLSRLRD